MPTSALRGTAGAARGATETFSVFGGRPRRGFSSGLSESGTGSCSRDRFFCDDLIGCLFLFFRR
jgi:hypothetical protein